MCRDVRSIDIQKPILQVPTAIPICFKAQPDAGEVAYTICLPEGCDSAHSPRWRLLVQVRKVLSYSAIVISDLLSSSEEKIFQK